MFARVKRSAERAYLVIVESRRELVDVERLGLDAELVPRQYEIARLGRVDHLDRARQDSLVAGLTELLADVRPTKGYNRKERAQPGGGTSNVR